MKIGTYAVEKDYSHYVAYASKTILAVVGTATKGPIGVATVCSSSQDLVNKFGPLNVNCMALYAGQYFLSQASKLYFVRAAAATAAKATTTISGLNVSDTTVADAMVIDILEEGTYYNNYALTLTAVTDKTITKYTFTLKDAQGATIEVVSNLEFDQLVVGYRTKYIKIKTVNSTAIKLTPETYKFIGGVSGISDIKPADYIKAASSLSADAVDMNLCAIPGVSDNEVVTYMLSLVENRGDTLYIVDPPKGLTRDGVIQWHNGKGEFSHPVYNSSYGALYYDWVRIYDSMNKTQVEVPPSVLAAATIAYSDRISDVWYAPAGLQRGLVRGALESVSVLNKADVDLLYSDENNVNSIYSDPQVGLVLWGQKTLSREDSALNRINVRRLMNYLKRVITGACTYLTFEPNDRITWNSFESLISPTLDSVQENRGIYGYHIVKGEVIVSANDIDNYRMPCLVMIRPTKSAEEIPIHFVITRTGADFNDVLDANGIISE